MNATAILDAIAYKHSGCAMVCEVSIVDADADRFAGADAWSAGGRVGPMPAFEPTSRRIDALMFDGTRTRTAIEVKVSRADFLRETDAKRRPWRKITHRFVYATPAGLLKPEEIPDGCGLWEVDGSAVRIMKRSKLNPKPDPIPHQVLVAFAYRMQRAAAAERNS